MAATTTATTRSRSHRSPARGETRVRRLGKALRAVVETRARSSYDRGVGYVRSEPMKALAIASAAGALAGLLLRRSK